MKKVFWILAALLVMLAGQASADFLSADIAGAGGEGFASLVTGSGEISFTILVSGPNAPTGAFLEQGGAQALDLEAAFAAGAAAGSVAASPALITGLDDNTSSYTLVVTTPAGNLTGTLQNAGDSGGGGPGPTPQPGVLRFTVDSVNVVEDQTVTLQVSRTGGTSGAVGVSYATQSGTAVSGEDFDPANGMLAWADGEGGNKSFDVTILDDDALELVESFTATLSNATGGATIAAGNSVIEISIGTNDLGDECVPSDTVLCLPGSGELAGRFSVTLEYATSQGGGVSGVGTVTPLAELEIGAGGIITMVDPENPEFLVKIINACETAFQAWWVFFAPTTNFGYTMTIIDHEAEEIRTFTNPDLTPAQPVQATTAATGAFVTCSFN